MMPHLLKPDLLRDSTTLRSSVSERFQKIKPHRNTTSSLYLHQTHQPFCSTARRRCSPPSSPALDPELISIFSPC
ncbi:hypothetical protein MHYP_G00061720 [Metynnis hypsauchen]